MVAEPYPRDLIGYGRNIPDPKWPGGARIAVQFVINYEEGGESCILDGDPASENLLSEIVGAAAWPGQRNLNMESIYEYGSRAGFWRLHRLFTELNVPCTVYGVTLAMMRNPDAVAAAFSEHILRIHDTSRAVGESAPGTVTRQPGDPVPFKPAGRP